MEIVLASFFTLSIWAAARGTLGNLSPSLTFNLVSSAIAGEARTQATAAKADRAAKRSMAELRVWNGRSGESAHRREVGAGIVASSARVSSSRFRTPNP